MFKKPFVLHPFLFTVYPVLFLFFHNIGQASIYDVFLPSAIMSGVTLFLVLLGRLILKDNRKAGIIVSLFLFLFFLYGRVYDAIWEAHIGAFMIGRHRYLMLLWGILFSCGAYFIIKMKRDLHKFTKILNIMAIALIIMVLINIGVYEFKERGTWEDISTEDSGIGKSGNKSSLRDIYYIILDGYASASTLKEFYNYDDSEFTDYLTGKGFYVAAKSRSNYSSTMYSVASTVNMEYINYVTELVGEESRNYRILYKLSENNKVIKFLKSRGYKYVHLNGVSKISARNKNADFAIQCGGWEEFQMVLIQTTMLSAFAKYFVEGPGRKMILGTFSKLSEVADSINGPKFVYAHICCPHTPYFFDANGDPVPDVKLKMDEYPWQEKEKYKNQLIFISKKVKILVDEILSKSEIPPIIILQADHGPGAMFDDPNRPEGTGDDNPTKKMLREKMRIFNAYHLPAGGNSVLYDSITPVNTFRSIFNYYFDADYELLDDRCYYIAADLPYKFIDVTDVNYD